MLFDCHIHMRTRDCDPELFAERLTRGGVAEAIIISLPPVGFSRQYPVCTGAERLQMLMDFCRGRSFLHPFYWLNPLEADAGRQVECAVAAGVEGFKIICSDFYPSHPAAMEMYRRIAERNSPVLFHTGILWDGKVSSKFCHPLEYECLLEIDDLRFTLAHVSWPWCDTVLAMYGKFLNAQATGRAGCEMFLDTTPGTPVICRREVLTKLYTIGYDIADNLLFGSDSDTGDYNIRWTQDWRKRDERILEELGVAPELRRNYFERNARRFLAGGRKEKNIPISGN